MLLSKDELKHATKVKIVKTTRDRDVKTRIASQEIGIQQPVRRLHERLWDS